MMKDKNRDEIAFEIFLALISANIESNTDNIEIDQAFKLADMFLEKMKEE